MRQELHAQRGADTSQAHTLGTAALRMRGVRQAFWAQGPLKEACTHAPTETAPRTAPATTTVLICGLLEWSEDVMYCTLLLHTETDRDISESLVCGQLCQGHACA